MFRQSTFQTIEVLSFIKNFWTANIALTMQIICFPPLWNFVRTIQLHDVTPVSFDRNDSLTLPRGWKFDCIFNTPNSALKTLNLFISRIITFGSWTIFFVNVVQYSCLLINQLQLQKIYDNDLAPLFKLCFFHS